MIKKFDNFEYIKEDDGGGCAMASMGSSNGMGAVVSATVGDTPGQVWGSGSGSIGSGDIGHVLGTYSKYPATGSFGERKHKKRRKKSKKNENIMIITKFEQFNEECCSDPQHHRYGNSVEEEGCTTVCLDCGMEVGDDLKSKKAHVYSKHWAHPTRNDEEANLLVTKLFV